MKKVALLLLCGVILIGGAGAYIITLSAPKTINAGEILTVNGTSNLAPGFSTEVSLSEVGSFNVISQKKITIQSDGSFSLTFNTSTLKEGIYKLEIPKNSSYGSSSTLWQFVEVIDRRDELSVSSPLTQTFDGTLEVAGDISTVNDRGLKIQVVRGGTTIFGPEYIPTSAEGVFDQSIPIDSGGSYVVTLRDSTDYPWFIQYTVVSPSPTPVLTSTTTEAPPVPQASGTASRTQPAYFQVETNRGELRAVTSAGEDWVIEYLDESGVINKVNTRGTAAEEVRFNASGGTVYFKIYPDQFGGQATITLSVENARSVSLCPTCGTQFGDVVTTPATPLPLFLALVALVIVILVSRRGS